MMSPKVICSGHLYLFPISPSSRCGSQLSFGNTPSPSPSAIIMSTPRRLLSTKTSSGPARVFKTRAMAGVCAPPTQTNVPESFYDLLGISETGSVSEIKKAYKQLARKYHPDVSPSGHTEEYTKRFIKVQEAYETLSDPQTRALYDLDLARGLQLTFSTTRRYERMDHEVEEWKRSWQSQLDELRLRSMHKDSVSARGKSTSSSWGTRIRQKRNDIFDLGFN